MRLLLTRGVDDAARTRTGLEALGHRVIESPVIEIADTGTEWPEGAIDAVLATSGQAFVVVGTRETPPREMRRLVPLFLVGDRTADAARSAGFAGPLTIAPNVASLAIAFGKLPDLPTRLLYLAGRERKPDLETALDVMGHIPEVIEVYNAQAASALSREACDALRRNSIGGVLHFSKRSALIFRRLAGKAEFDIRPLKHFCLSEDVAQALHAADCTDVRVSVVPSEASLLALVGEA